MLQSLIRCSLSDGEVYQKMCQASHKGSYISYIRGRRCRNEDDFFMEISASFQFPSYFGENWAALDECLCDLEWLQFDGIIVVVDDFSVMFGGKKELQERLIKYFNIMIDYWKEKDVFVVIWLNN